MKALEVIKAGSKLLKDKNISTHILDSELLISQQEFQFLNKTKNLNIKIKLKE